MKPPSSPTGDTFTFLFTDIEGSTRLWEEDPDGMRQALARHDALLRAAIEHHGGRVFKTIGDAFCAAFTRAPAAVFAALAAQRALLGESMGSVGSGETSHTPHTSHTPLTSPLRVRMALHTGAAEARDDDYFGPALNRVARLLGASHGGQILLSEAAYGLVCDDLTEGIDLRDLGTHRLRDLRRAEHIFELTHPDLPSGFPPIRSLNTVPNNLPQQWTSFVGREKEMAAVRALLRKSRLLTVTGAGGTGKTRLSLQLAAELLDLFPDGVWFVELATVSDPDRVSQEVAAALGVREEPGESLDRTLIEQLKAKQLLILLDNCEHLLEAAAHLARALLRHCPGAALLATSREALNIAGEFTYRLPSLSLPDSRRLEASLESLARYESVRLFTERAAAALPSFSLNERNAPAVTGICRRLDGIPLALELAAARVRSLPVEEIYRRLDDRFRLLAGGRATLPRQQTLRALIDWSYDLLSPEEQEFFRRVSVFAGGFDLEAAEEVCADADLPDVPNPHSAIRNQDVLDLTCHLVDRCLLTADEREGCFRYRWLETQRQYAREKLQESGRADPMQCRHLAYYLRLVEEVERKLRGSEQAAVLERLEVEQDNLSAALDYAARHDPAAGLRLTSRLWWFWHVRGYFAEGREWLAVMLANAPERNAIRAKALLGAGVLARNQGDYEAARELSEESLAIRRELGDRQGIAACLNNLAKMALSQGDYGAARPFYEQSLTIERDLGNRQGVTACLIGLANVALEQGDAELARLHFEETWRIKEELGDQRGVAASLSGLGNAALFRGELVTARSLQERSLEIRQELGDRRGIAASLHSLGMTYAAAGQLALAGTHFEKSIALRRELGDRLGTAESLHGLGEVLLRQGDRSAALRWQAESLRTYAELGHRSGMAASLAAIATALLARAQDSDPAGGREVPAEATRLLSAAAMLREDLGVPLRPAEQEAHARSVSALRILSGERAFVVAWDEGRNAPVERAITWALGASY